MERSIGFASILLIHANPIMMNKHVDTPIIRQASNKDCGLVSLAIILNYYGIEVSWEKMKTQIKVSKYGSSAKDLVAYARSLGFFSNGYRMNTRSLIGIDPPAILHWDSSCFFSIVGYENGSVLIESELYKECRAIPESEFRNPLIFLHFLVYEGHNQETFFINDPYLGKRSINKKDFMKAFTGYILVMRPYA